VPRPPAICFVDLTGSTRLTEERRDEVAAQVAGQLAALVNDISRSRGGRPTSASTPARSSSRTGAHRAS
jgi:class 3 adenylate cyclase